MSLPREIVWPECFVTGKIDKDADDRVIVAACLGAWANCMMGTRPPEHFGKVLVEVGKRLGISASADGLSEYAKNKGWLD